MVRNVDELQEKYKIELLEFLIQKINDAGGSLQFQHLSGLLQQLRFEIKDAFGSTKSALMKFLKANQNSFKVNSKGVVTVVDSTLGSNNCCAEEDNQTDLIKKTSLSKIINGEGHIFKIFPQYGIIKAEKPIDTYIFFTPLEYGAGKDSLFVDLDLEIQDEVGFNATHGHFDYEIEYRATKVWKIYYSDDDSPHLENIQRNQNTMAKMFTGQGVIKKVYSDVGVISVSGKENECIFFYKSKFKCLNISAGDQVEFVAVYSSNEWQATEITKKKNINKLSDHPQACINKPSDHSQASMKQTDKGISEESIENESGRIFFHQKNATIKFGKNFSKSADGSACNFYLYGIKVAYDDIAMEFSEGDDVKFDAVKSEDSCEWKAVLAWVGEKPATIPKNDMKFKEKFNNTKSTNEVDHDKFSSHLLSEVPESRKRRSIKNQEINVIGRGNELNKIKARFNNPPKVNVNSRSEKYHKDNIVASKIMPPKISHKDSKSRLDKSKKKYNKNFNNKCNEGTSFSKSKAEKKIKNWHFSKDPDLDISDSEIGSEENNELQDSSDLPRKFLKEDKQYLPDILDLKGESLESDSEYESVKSFTKEKSRIKEFEAIDGEIIRLCCKVGFIKSDRLMKEVDFVLHVFFLNGKSAEEQGITDLTEIIKVGDIITFNCYEIVDDNGEIHRQVTKAWIGPKPTGYEMTLAEFISGLDFKVSSFDPDYEKKLVRRFDSSTSITFDEVNSEAESSLNDDTLQECSAISKSRLDNVDEHRSSVVADHEKLPDLVLRKLETYGFLSSNSKGAFNCAQEIIDLVLENSSIKDISVNQNYPFKSDSANLCSSCGKTEKSLIEGGTTTDAEAQTTITGEIVATSIFTEDY